MVFLITYDLNGEDKKYEELEKAIDSISTRWCRCCESSFLIKTNLVKANDVFTELEPYLDNDDSCLVVEVKNNKQGYQTESQWSYINKEIFDSYPPEA